MLVRGWQLGSRQVVVGQPLVQMLLLREFLPLHLQHHERGGACV